MWILYVIYILSSSQNNYPLWKHSFFLAKRKIVADTFLSTHNQAICVHTLMKSNSNDCLRLCANSNETLLFGWREYILCQWLGGCAFIESLKSSVICRLLICLLELRGVVVVLEFWQLHFKKYCSYYLTAFFLFIFIFYKPAFD